MEVNETIAAVSTPLGSGGIGIIRISGSNAFDIAEVLFKGKRPFKKIKSHTINYGHIVRPGDGGIVDEVMLTKLDSPNTFTREDVIEINCHGGNVVMLQVLDLVIQNGARLAEPGEFTKRAFLNGRLDLSQAEAVIDIINAKTTEGSKAAIAQLNGRLSLKIGEMRKELVSLIAHIEVTVDYPEHDIEEVTGQQVYNGIDKVLRELQQLADGYDKGRFLREGLNVVIAGRPNVGKSSLLNMLTGKSRAIVTDIPGTTRDIIEEYTNIRGIPIRLHDTAGIRETIDPVEKIGVGLAGEAMEKADLTILMLDCTQNLNDDDISLMERLKDKKVIYILNKTDICKQESIAQIESKLEGKKSIRASIKNAEGIDELEKSIEGMFQREEIGISSELLINNARHKNLIDMAVESLNQAGLAYETGMPLDMITIDIKNAAESLGMITGDSVSDEVVKEIFNRFCIGK